MPARAESGARQITAAAEHEARETTSVHTLHLERTQDGATGVHIVGRDSRRAYASTRP